jgi:outer membrane biosynthesis protein TonB
MHARALDEDGRSRAVLLSAIASSMLLHAGAGWSATRIEPRERAQVVWAEVAVVEPPPPPPPPPPEPEPEPEPERPAPRPAEPPPPDAEPPPPEAEPVPQVVQGLSASSFLAGAGTGLTVRAGTTTSAKAEGAGLALDDAKPFAPVAYAAVSRSPKIKRKPVLAVPPELRELGIEGVVEVLLTIGVDGAVADLVVKKGLHEVADKACLDALRGSRWDPGVTGDAAQVVSGVPYACRFEKVTP